MGRVWLALTVVVAGCGRFDFDPEVHVRSTLRTDRVDLGTTLADFPALVVLDDQRADRASMQTDGSDLRFFADDGTPLAFEIEQVGAPAGPPLLAWVEVPMLDSATAIGVDYGHPPATANPGSPWNAGYVAVWHLDAKLAIAADSTGHGHDAVAVTTTTGVAGIVADGRSIDPSGMTGALRVQDAADLDLPAATVSGWMDLNATAPWEAIATRQIADSDANDIWVGASFGNATCSFSTDAVMDTHLNGAAVAVGRWIHVAATHDGATMSVYLDGALSASVPLPGTVSDSHEPIYLGAECSGTCSAANADFVDGVIDEIRIERVPRSAAWIRADDLTARDQLITYGPVE